MATSACELQSRKKDKNQHIQVFVRVRPQNQSEIFGRSVNVIDVTSAKEIVVKERQDCKQTKKFTFDKVFGPLSKQIDVYQAVVSPLLEEVLAGYNCTVFAYGQTGTGKTFTMEGHSNDSAISWQSDSTAGIIPRALSHLFDELKSLESQEFTVRVSFLELYNEELFDLLSPNDDTKIRLYEDSTKRGTVIIHGLEEVTVHNKSEVYKILEKGSEKRQTAATLMNAQSSRSHTVFSITVHIKENTVEGEELLKTGKLNLVDLAGSENVGRSGAVDRRAREAGNINQSLLTLGRVITALVERAPHIPYRESKLTRLLQESLGGRTKTSIIATISPASINLEETLSTLDYAHRAKNITNRPEINQKLSKKALLKQYTEEIERLKRDLQATRERNGVYLAQDNYNEMQVTIEVQGKDIEEKTNHIKALEDTMMAKELILNELKMNLENLSMEIDSVKKDRDENKVLLNCHVKTEKKLYKQGERLLKVADTVVSDTNKLHDKVERSKQVEYENDISSSVFNQNVGVKCTEIKRIIDNHYEHLIDLFKKSVNINESNRDICVSDINNSNDLILGEFISEFNDTIGKLEDNGKNSYEKYKNWFDEELNNIKLLTNEESESMKKILDMFVPKIQQLVNNEIATNLQKINQTMNDKLNHLLIHMKSTMDKMFNEFHGEYNNIKKELEVDDKRFDARCQDQIISVNETDELQDMLKSMYDNLNHKINQLKSHGHKSVATIDDDKSHRKIIYNQFVKLPNIQNNIQKVIETDVNNRVNDIKTNLTDSINKNVNIAMDTEEEGKLIASQLEEEINTHENTFKSRQNERSVDISKMKDSSSSDWNDRTQLVNQTKELVFSTSVKNKKLLEKCRENVINNTGNINDKLNGEMNELETFKEDINSGVNSIKVDVDKFVTEDLKRVETTGLTPVKKDYQYPRKLAQTLPHERILKRLRTENYQSNQLDSSLLDDSIVELPEESESTIVRSVSVNDLDSLGNHDSTEHRTHSESEVDSTPCNNKENTKVAKLSKISFIPKANANSNNGNNNNNKRVLLSKNE